MKRTISNGYDSVSRAITEIDHSAPSLAFQLHRIERRLQLMNVAEVGVDDELAVAPRGILVSADEEGQGELLHHKIAEHLEIVIGK